MATVLLIIHIMIALAMIGLVLLQRSEGGALGIGGGGGGGFMTGRGAANFLTRATAGLAAAFFTTSLVLSLIASQPGRDRSILDQAPVAAAGRYAEASSLDAAAHRHGTACAASPVCSACAAVEVTLDVIPGFMPGIQRTASALPSCSCRPMRRRALHDGSRGQAPG